MLELKKIKKSYTTGDFNQIALKEASVTFRTTEFVAILGPSGSGKTTLLNIVGGLDRYDSGDLVINGKSTKQFNDADWDAYRNNCVGFVFQSYNLIGHISVLQNVEMCMTLSGVGRDEKKKRALKALEKVGLKEHSHKKPNQLSGGQMQRVAIARALVNDPDIILADEPTGALDSKTSVQIMELIKEIAKDKLVIMVTHNSELANEYANSIIKLKDGEVEADSNKIKTTEKIDDKFSIKRTAMGFLSALSLSFNNIKTKKGRTLLTAFASSIGIIGIALILSLSNGFDIQIDKFEKDTLSNMPIMISEQIIQMNEGTMQQMMGNSSDEDDYPSEKKVYPQKAVLDEMTHNNVLSKEYVEYVEDMDDDWFLGINYIRATNLNIISKLENGYQPMNFGSSMFSMMELPWKNDEKGKYEFTDYYFDKLQGDFPENKNEMVLLVDSKNRINSNILDALGIDSSKDSIDFEEILNIELKLVSNNDFYKSMGKIYTVNTDFEALYNSSDSETIKIVGIIRGKETEKIETGNDSALLYSKELMSDILKKAKTSDIVKDQEKANYNIMTGEVFAANAEGVKAKETIMAYLGGNDIPSLIRIYSRDFDSKEKVVNYLDAYNEGKAKDEKIVYTDLGAMLSRMSGNIMSGITYVLIAFSAISLVVSTIMIAIITYISVLERTKEIGVLRALGARKKDVTRVFNAETFIIGLSSGILGIGIARLLLFPINALLLELTSLKNVAVLNPMHALILIVISITLTLLGGFIPAKIASKKDPVIALRTE